MHRKQFNIKIYCDSSFNKDISVSKEKEFFSISHVQNVTNVPYYSPVVAVDAGLVAVLGTAVLPGLLPAQQLYVNNRKCICVVNLKSYTLFQNGTILVFFCFLAN